MVFEGLDCQAARIWTRGIANSGNGRAWPNFRFWFHTDGRGIYTYLLSQQILNIQMYSEKRFGADKLAVYVNPR